MGFGLKGISSIARVTGICALLLAAPATAQLGLNYVSNNQTIETRDSITISRIDGLMGYTKYRGSLSPNGQLEDRVEQARIFSPSRIIVDGGAFGERDGLADEIATNSPAGVITLYRESDYDNFKAEFDDADNYLASTKRRFASELRNWQLNALQTAVSCLNHTIALLRKENDVLALNILRERAEASTRHVEEYNRQLAIYYAPGEPRDKPKTLLASAKREPDGWEGSYEPQPPKENKNETDVTTNSPDFNRFYCAWEATECPAGNTGFLFFDCKELQCKSKLPKNMFSFHAAQPELE